LRNANDKRIPTPFLQREGKRVQKLQGHCPAGTVILTKAKEPDNGKFCRVRMAKIDLAVCTVQSVRTPALCDGCGGAA